MFNNNNLGNSTTLQWRHNERDGVPNHRYLECLLKRLFRRRSKKTSKLRVTGLCEGNPPVTGGFPSQRASNAENVSIWWRHHEDSSPLLPILILDLIPALQVSPECPNHLTFPTFQVSPECPNHLTFPTFQVSPECPNHLTFPTFLWWWYRYDPPYAIVRAAMVVNGRLHISTYCRPSTCYLDISYLSRKS